MTTPNTPGRNEQAVIEEAQSYRAARPALYETAITLGKLMDNPNAVTQHSVAATRLAAILKELRGGQSIKAGPLAAVREMNKQATG